MKLIFKLTLLILILTSALKAQSNQNTASNYPNYGTKFTGDSLLVTHSQGSGEGNVYVVIENPSQLTNHPYEVFFKQQTYYRNQNGEWIPIDNGDRSDGPDTLTGSTIDIGAVYGPSSGIIEIRCHLNLISPDYNWADGISMSFPSGITVISAPPFEAGNGWVYPEIVGNIVNMGIVNGPPSGNGVFTGDEEWTIFIATFTPPITIDWIIYDDGYSGGVVNAEGSSEIDSIGYAMKTQNEWNLKDISTQDSVLKHQTVIMGYDIYTGQYVGDPVVDGFKISVDVTYDPPVSIGSLELNGEPLGIYDPDANYQITDFTLFGTVDATAATTLPLYGGAGGTTNLNMLQQDYELRWTGVFGDTTINSKTVVITKSGGSIATIFGASFYSLADHPLNPNPGVEEPFTIRIPFENWNTDKNDQVNLLVWDRNGSITADTFFVWNIYNRMYTWTVNSQYNTNVIDPVSQLVADSATWNWAFFKSLFTTGDVINIHYRMPVEFGVDIFTFNTPPAGLTGSDLFQESFELFQNYPNPFNPVTTIKYSIPERSNVSLTLFDVLGQEIDVLVKEEQAAGNYTFELNAGNLSSGIYFYTLTTGNFRDTKKLILLK